MGAFGHDPRLQPSPAVGGGGTHVRAADLAALRADAARLAANAPLGVASLFPGAYRSLFRGRGLEFEEVRAYQPGDDFRMLDWKVTARTGVPHTKIFREEREYAFHVVLDLGAGMAFGTRRALKSVAAAETAAVLAWLAVDCGDRVGGLVAGAGSGAEVRPMGGTSGALRLFHLFEREAASSEAGISLGRSLGRVRRVAHANSQILVASDFAGLDAEGEGALMRLARHHDVALALVVDPIEAALPPPGRYPLRDRDGVFVIDSADADLRARHAEALARRRQRLRTLCRDGRMRLFEVPTERTAFDILHGRFMRPPNARAAIGGGGA